MSSVQGGEIAKNSAKNKQTTNKEKEKERARESMASQVSSYTLRPNFKNKFKPAVVKELIHQVLVRRLSNQAYDAENTPRLTKEISDEIKVSLKALQSMERYKVVVQVVMGEQKGEGVKMACRCFWDSDTDGLASETYTTDTLFCVASAYGIYYY